MEGTSVGDRPVKVTVQRVNNDLMDTKEHRRTTSLSTDHFTIFDIPLVSEHINQCDRMYCVRDEFYIKTDELCTAQKCRFSTDHDDKFLLRETDSKQSCGFCRSPPRALVLQVHLTKPGESQNQDSALA